LAQKKQLGFIDTRRGGALGARTRDVDYGDAGRDANVPLCDTACLRLDGNELRRGRIDDGPERRIGETIRQMPDHQAEEPVIRGARTQGAVETRMAETERQFQQYVGGFRALLERQLAELRALDGQK
jgi:hypothetical protein